MDVRASFQEFMDVDRFREVLRGWDTEPTQLTPGKLTVRWDQLSFDDLAISRLRTDRRISEHSSYQAGHFGFVICLSSKNFCGRSVPAGSLVVFGPGREYRNILQDNWESFEIVMSSQLLLSMGYAASILRRLALGPERSVMHLSPQLAGSFRDWSSNFIAPFRLQNNNLAADPFWAGTVRERTLSLLYEAMHENGNVGVEAHPLKRLRGWDLAVRALEYIDRHEHERLSVRSISEDMGCSTRALQSAFEMTLGVTPLRYVLARRLHLARRDLLFISNGASSITKAAANNGFMHFGRFSQYYRVLFGEFPSNTVQRARIIKSAK